MAYRIIITCILILIINSGKSQKIISIEEESSQITLSDLQHIKLSKEFFTQLEPEKGAPSSKPTSVYLWYDSTSFYFYIKCFQDKESIVANLQARDVISNDDDNIVLVLDTYNDERTAYGFWVNPIGTQADFKILDDGRTISNEWDTEWEVQTSISDSSWDALISIPFSSLKYKKKQSTWGFNVSRMIRDNFESSWWSGEMNDDFRISQGGKLSGVMVPEKRKWLTLFPYVTLRYEDQQAPEKNQEVKPEFGGDIRMQVLSSLQANLTVNPDFATVEGDRERINLSRYELRYPEKRLFFQEGNEMFKTRIRTFYSRRIGDIDFGGKVTGKVGDYAVNAISVKSSKDSELDTTGAWFSAFRMKRDILKSSTIGITYADKSWNGGYARSISADYTLNLGNAWKLTGQFVGSFPGQFSTHSAWFVRFARESNIYHYHIRFTSLGTKFQENVNQTGFITDEDRLELDGDITYKWWMNKSNTLQYIYVGTANNAFWSHKGTLRSWYLTDKLRFYFKNKISVNLMYNNEFKLFEKKYYNNKYGLTLGYNTDEWTSASLEYQQGRNFDRDFFLITANGSAKVFKKLSIDYSGNYLEFNPDTTNASTFINIVSLNYYINKNLWVRLFAQNSTNSDRIYIYGLMAWRFKPPFGVVYLIYSKDKYEILPENKMYNKNVFFIKLTYPISI